MKRTSHAIAGLVTAALLSSCGGGTLGGGAGGMVGTLTGSAGVTSPGSGIGGVPRTGTGVAGFAGIAGHGGPGGDLGTGGTFVLPCPPANPPVCGALCGDGRVDQCTHVAASWCPGQVVSEECDGDDFAGDSCAARGYATGTLTCNADCTRGPETCSPCLPPSALIAGCRPRPAPTVSVGTHALSATDREVGMVSFDHNPNTGQEAIAFDRLSASLDLVSRTWVNDMPLVFYGVGVASRPSGWLVAVCGFPELYVLVFDANGQNVGRTVVAQISNAATDGCTTPPVMVTRPGGGPLLLWVAAGAMSTSLIAADGRSASAPQTLVGSGALPWPAINAAWVGDEFAVAVPIGGGALVPGLRLMAVAPDGTSRFVDDVLSDQFLDSAAMATGPDARDVRIVYNGVPPGSSRGPDAAVIWWRYDPSAPGPFAVLGATPDYSPRAPAVAFGDDTVVLLSRPLADGLGVVRVTSDGSVGPIRDVAIGRGIYALDMVRRGPEVVVSIVGPNEQIFLARVTP